MTSGYNGCKISGSQQSFLTEELPFYSYEQLCTVIFFYLLSAIFAGPRVLNSRNFVIMATWRNDFLLLTVYKAHISKVYFVVVVLILHVLRLTAVKTSIRRSKNGLLFQFYSFTYNTKQENKLF